MSEAALNVVCHNVEQMHDAGAYICSSLSPTALSAGVVRLAGRAAGSSCGLMAGFEAHSLLHGWTLATNDNRKGSQGQN